MRNFGTTVIRAVPIPNFSPQTGQTIPFRNIDSRVYSKSENDEIAQNKDIESDSESDDDIKKNFKDGEIIGTFPNYPETMTLNRLFDQVIDNYSSYPIFGTASYTNNATENIQKIATELLSTNNQNTDNKKENENKKQDNFEWLTYGEFGELVKATASGFLTIGEFSTRIGEDGEFVGILLENSIYFPLVQWACAYIGAVIVPIDLSYPPEIVISIIQTFKCSSLICSISTFKNYILKMFPTNNPGKVSKIFLFCEDSDLTQLTTEYQEKFNETNNANKTIEQIISEDIRIKFFSLPQIILPQAKPSPKKPKSPKKQINNSKKDQNDEDDASDVEIDDGTDYLTNNNAFSRLPQIHPDTMCALNTGTGRCGSLKPCYLTHYNLIAAASGVESCGYKLGRDIYMSNIPMYRAFERSLQLSIIANGGCIGIMNDDDLKKINDLNEEEEKSQKSKSNRIYNKADVVDDDDDKNNYEVLFDTLNLMRPTILALTGDAVKEISDGLISKISKLNVFKRMFFDFTFKLAEQASDSFSAIPWISKTLAIDEYRKMVGGRLRLIISTSRYLNPQVQHNIQTILQIPVIQMYGVTEAGGICCIQNVNDKDVMNVGAPTTSCEIRLRNFAVAKTNVNCGDQGEILIRGPSLFKCYHKNEDLTRQSMTEDGWFATGDLGKINANGTVQIIDTIMDFTKRRQERIENGYYY